MRILFIEPPKNIWFVMGEYLPPPFGILQLAAYLDREIDGLDIHIVDCNAEKIDWDQLSDHIREYNPNIVASSSLATCNAYAVVRTLDIAKQIDPETLTVTGGQHFTATAEESLRQYPVIDVIVRGEGEQSLTDLVQCVQNQRDFHHVRGISFRQQQQIHHNSCRPLLHDLDSLPFPGYHFVRPLMQKYHFAAMMGPSAPYALIEGSRGCSHRCTFCTQWQHWSGTWRSKSPQRIAAEMIHCYHEYGSRFIWLTDDNFGFGKRGQTLAQELLKQHIPDDLVWFTQARCDDVIHHRTSLPELRRAGLRWILLGIEHNQPATLNTYKKQITPDDATRAVKLLQQHDIFAQAMFIIGERQDTAQSIEDLRQFADALDPDFAIFATLTPFPGTELYTQAKQQGWIEDHNWAHYDMIHAIMPTETLSRNALQNELYKCYQKFYGSWSRRVKGMLSTNMLRRRIYWYMVKQGILHQLQSLNPSAK
jgi:anaerobic magnesium-protoporphyrin IX monomethyl ester cyclase